MIRGEGEKLGLDGLVPEMAKGMVFEGFPDVCRTLAEKAEQGSYEHVNLFLDIIDGHYSGKRQSLPPRAYVREPPTAPLLREDGEGDRVNASCG